MNKWQDLTDMEVNQGQCIYMTKSCNQTNRHYGRINIATGAILQVGKVS